MGRKLRLFKPRRRRCLLCQQPLPTKPKGRAKGKATHKRPAW